MPTYEFTVYGVGDGETEEDAWEDAWQHLIQKVQNNEYDDARVIGDESAY